MHVYLDESGDEGWVFDKPFRDGGSSRYLCLAFLFVPKDLRKLPKAIISDLYRKYKWSKEKKAASAALSIKLEFCAHLNALLAGNPTIKAECIIVKKQNVSPHIRRDPHKLYNYMCRLVMIDQIKHLNTVEFIPDKRSVKVESGNSLSDYLQTVLWFDHSATTALINNPQESDKNYNLQFVDWIANCVWSHFEDGECAVFMEIKRNLKIRTLFF